MSRVLDTNFCYTDKKQCLVGSVGKHGELTQASLYFGERPIVSLTADMHKVREFDGLMAINTQGELAQLIGIYFHGNLYPYNWKTLADDIVRLIHKAVDKGRGMRVIIPSIKYIDVTEIGKNYSRLVSDKSALFTGNIAGRQFADGDLENKALGEDKHFIEMQGRVLANQLSKGGTTVKFVSGKGNAMLGNNKTKAQLISKVENHPVLVPIK